MPQIFRVGPYSIYFWSNENNPLEPIHVHIAEGKATANATKVWITNVGYEKAKASIEESLKKLRTDYLDLLLIHQPFGDYYGTYRAMEEFYKAGKIRAIGVSNFGPDRYLDLEYFSEIKPAVNQVETHVFQQRRLPFDFCCRVTL